MNMVKKLFFAPFFLFSLVCLLIFSDQIIAEPLSLIFSIGSTNGWTILYLVLTLLTTSLFFTIFSTLSNDLKLTLPVIILASLIPFGLFVDLTLASTLAIGFAISLLIIFFIQQQKMKSYITFSAYSLLHPQIKLLNLLLVLTLSVGFYLMVDKKIAAEGFSIPDPLIETVINLSGQKQQLEEATEQQQESPMPTLPQLSPQILQQLKANPQLLRQYGITTQQLDALSQAQQNTKPNADGSQPSLVSTLVKTQIDKMLEPYIQWIPSFLTLLFFISISSLASFFSLLLALLIPLIFTILEKTNVIHFEKELREVKKLVV